MPPAKIRLSGCRWKTKCSSPPAARCLMGPASAANPKCASTASYTSRPGFRTGFDCAAEPDCGWRSSRIATGGPRKDLGDPKAPGLSAQRLRAGGDGDANDNAAPAAATARRFPPGGIFDRPRRYPVSILSQPAGGVNGRELLHHSTASRRAMLCVNAYPSTQDAYLATNNSASPEPLLIRKATNRVFIRGAKHACCA
jgi:hypothetical protein